MCCGCGCVGVINVFETVFSTFIILLVRNKLISLLKCVEDSRMYKILSFHVQSKACFKSWNCNILSVEVEIVYDCI